MNVLEMHVMSGLFLKIYSSMNRVLLLIDLTFKLHSLMYGLLTGWGRHATLSYPTCTYWSRGGVRLIVRWPLIMDWNILRLVWGMIQGRGIRCKMLPNLNMVLIWYGGGIIHLRWAIINRVIHNICPVMLRQVVVASLCITLLTGDVIRWQLSGWLLRLGGYCHVLHVVLLRIHVVSMFIYVVVPFRNSCDDHWLECYFPLWRVEV